MAGQHTMAELLRAPTEVYAEEIVVPPILAEHFELKHSLINMMTSDQFFGLKKDNPHDHIHLLRAYPHRGFTELHQLDTFYNALNPADQDSSNSTADGNLLESRTQDVLTIIKNKSMVRNSRNKLIVSQVKSSNGNSSSSSEIAKLTHAVNQQTSDVTTPMPLFLKKFKQPHLQLPYNPLRKFVLLAVVLILIISVSPPMATLSCNFRIIFKDTFQQPRLTTIRINEVNIKSMQAQINNVKNELRNKMQTLIQASMSNQTNELKKMMPSFFQMNTASTLGLGPLPSNTISNPKGKLKSITTRTGLVLDGPFVPMPPPFINPDEDERGEETLKEPKLAKYTIKVPPPLMLKALFYNKEKLLELANIPLNENCLAVILKKLPEKLGDPGKFLIPCGFSELKCKALADLANRAICTSAGIARDVFVLVRRFTFLNDFVIVDYENNPRVPLILGRPFLRTACALIDVHGEEMILRDDDERLTLNMRHDTSIYSNQPHKESINMINIYNDSYEDYLEDLFATNHLSGNPTFSSHTDLTSPEVINPLSGNTTSSSPEHLLEELADELALITFPPGNDDLLLDIESDHREVEYFLNHDPTKEMDSILEDSVDECNLANLNNDLVDTIPKMFTDEHTLDYSPPPLYDDVNDDLVELESDNDDVYDDPFDSKEDKIKESKLLINELDPPRSSDFLPSPEYDSVLYEDFSEVDALPSTNNEDKDFNPLLYELPFHKEVPRSKTLLSFSSENKEKVFNPEILTSKGVHTSLPSELSHRALKLSKSLKFLKARWRFFLALMERTSAFGCFVSQFLSPINNLIRETGQA
nr:hypothetical protein [Tanacetum cinerariifolium]